MRMHCDTQKEQGFQRTTSVLPSCSMNFFPLEKFVSFCFYFLQCAQHLSLSFHYVKDL